MVRPDDRASAAGAGHTRTTARHYEAAGHLPARHMNQPKGWPLWLKIATWAASLVILSGAAFAAYWVIRLQSNINKAPLTAGSAKSNGADDRKDRLQILILGSDTRDGKNSQYGTAEDSSGYGQSDVMMLLDISKDNKRVSVTSFPRDLLVDIPACTDHKTGKSYPARKAAMINTAMAEAGIGCAVDTVSKLTGMEIDHFMMADFNAVKELSATVGGVDVCITDAVYDPDSGLRLPKGTSQVEGEQALAFLRARHAFADGGDLGRIRAQQSFLSALTRKIKSDGTLGDPQKLLRIADVVTQNLTVDEGLANVQSLLTIGSRLKDIDVSKVAFVAVPTQPAPNDPNRLVLVQPQATQLFAAQRADLDLTTPGATATPPATPTPTESTGATTAPPTPAGPAPKAYDKSVQPVAVADGTGAPARAQELAQALIAAGFTQSVHFPAQSVEQTVVYYGPGFADVAADVAAMFGIPAAQVQPAASVRGVQLYVGGDFASGTQYGQASVPKDVVDQTASDVVCQVANPEVITG